MILFCFDWSYFIRIVYALISNSTFEIKSKAEHWSHMGKFYNKVIRFSFLSKKYCFGFFFPPIFTTIFLKFWTSGICWKPSSKSTNLIDFRPIFYIFVNNPTYIFQRPRRLPSFWVWTPETCLKACWNRKSRSERKWSYRAVTRIRLSTP